MSFDTADDGTEPIQCRQYSGNFATLKRTAVLLDGSGNTSFPGTLNAGALDASLLKKIGNFIYPVGALYLSFSNTSPASLFGGTWTQITNRFIWCANGSGSTGGTDTHLHNLSGNGAACIAGQDNNWIYEKQGSKTFTANRVMSVSGQMNGSWSLAGVELTGTTDNITGNYPPYIWAYCWRRVSLA